MNPTQKPKKLPKKINWNLTYREISAKLGGIAITILQEEYARRFPGQRKHFKSRPVAKREKWQRFKTWDWSLNNAELGRLNGCSGEYARQIRKKLKMPESPRAGLHTKNVL